MIKISVIIPAKNEEKNIGACLKSIFGNEFNTDQFEVIVVDNGSKDSTINIAETYGAKVFSKPDVSISALRNFGASVATGKVLSFIDADCTVDRHWFENALKYVENEEVVCFGSPPVIPEKPTWVQKTWFLVRLKESEIVETQWLESMNMFIKKKFFNKVGGFDENLITCEDVDISYRLSEFGKIISDINIKAVHHGEAATVKEFFRKERWRGKSNYQGLMAHGLKLKEFPSLFLPAYYGLLGLLTVFSLLFMRINFVSVSMLLLWQLPIVMVVIVKLRNKAFDLKKFRNLLALYNVYYSARFLSVFS